MCVEEFDKCRFLRQRGKWDNRDKEEFAYSCLQRRVLTAVPPGRNPLIAASRREDRTADAPTDARFSLRDTTLTPRRWLPLTLNPFHFFPLATKRYHLINQQY